MMLDVMTFTPLASWVHHVVAAASWRYVEFFYYNFFWKLNVWIWIKNLFLKRNKQDNTFDINDVKYRIQLCMKMCKYNSIPGTDLALAVWS